MGKISGKESFLVSAKARWGWFIKKSPAFIVLTSLTVVSVFGLGVGGTLAATGVIPNPFVSATEAPSEEAIEPSSRIPGDGTFPQQLKGFDSLDELKRNSCYDSETYAADWECLAKMQKGINTISDSGWTGVKFRFIQGGYHMVIGAIPTPGSNESPSFVTSRFSVNGVEKNSGQWCWNYGSWTEKGEVCVAQEYGPINASGACLPGGDTYLIEVSGGGVNFRESGLIPAGIINCPSIPQTIEPSPTPTSESSPTPTTDPSPTPTTEPSPTPTTEPSPSPSGP